MSNRWIPLLAFLAAAPLLGCDAGEQPYAQAVAAEARNDYDAALAHYTAVLAHPKSKHAETSKAKAAELEAKLSSVKAVLDALPELESRGAYDQALSSLQEAETQLPGYEPTTAAVTRVKKTFAGVLFTIGDTLLQDRKFVEAEAAYRKIGDLYPDDPAVAAKLKLLEEARARIPFQVRTPMTARISDVKIAASAITFTLLNANFADAGHACFQVHPEWTGKDGRRESLERRRYELPNGQSRPIQIVLPEGRSLFDAELVILVVAATRC